MSRLIVYGGRKLIGEVMPSGSKNAVLPMIFAALTAHGRSVLRGAPNISDVTVALRLIEELGATVERIDGAIVIDTYRLKYRAPSREKTTRLRASTYLIGASLAVFGRAELPECGGCSFSVRPIDMHIYAAECLGARRCGNVLTCDRLRGGDVRFDKKSVGATANALIMASSAEGESRIYNAATEPHIDALVTYLRACGADITLSADTFTVVGGELHGAEVTVPCDSIEAATYLSLGAICGGGITVRAPVSGEMLPFLNTVEKGGCNVEKIDTGICISGNMTESASVFAAPYPAFATDMQPLIAPMLACGRGGEIYDSVFPSRFGYLSSVAEFGVSFDMLDGGARIYPSHLRAASSRCVDLRGGASALICALAADGQSELYDADILYRGYEDLTEKLTRLGATVRYEQ